MPVMVILMLLPLIALPVFWYLPLPQAIAIYAVSVLISGAMHWLMHSTMKRPVVTGAESLIGKDAEVVSRSDRLGISYQVRVKNELWTADSREDLLPGETVMITAVKENRLIVKHKDADSRKTTTGLR
jgi:membrane protein implicated in regulation of membrane protease activity